VYPFIAAARGRSEHASGPHIRVPFGAKPRIYTDWTDCYGCFIFYSSSHKDWSCWTGLNTPSESDASRAIPPLAPHLCVHQTGSRGGAESGSAALTSPVGRGCTRRRTRAPCVTGQTRTRVNVFANCYNSQSSLARRHEAHTQIKCSLSISPQSPHAGGDACHLRSALDVDVAVSACGRGRLSLEKRA